MKDLSRGIVVIVLLLVTGAFLQQRKQPEKVPAHQTLAEFPRELGTWRGQVIPITNDVREVLGDGDFLDIYYRPNPPQQPAVDLFMAYFQTQRTGSTIHSPKNCLPGSGWTPMEAEHMLLPVPNGPPIHANRYVIAKGAEKQLVLYWYQAHGRTTASEYAAKFYLIADAMRMNRSDGALVRLVTPIASNEDSHGAEQRLIAFAQNVGPQLDHFIPR
jgi:EpsI family protein